jgi:hypothetical protein
VRRCVDVSIGYSRSSRSTIPSSCNARAVDGRRRDQRLRGGLQRVQAVRARRATRCDRIRRGLPVIRIRLAATLLARSLPDRRDSSRVGKQFQPQQLSEASSWVSDAARWLGGVTTSQRPTSAEKSADQRRDLAPGQFWQPGSSCERVITGSGAGPGEAGGLALSGDRASCSKAPPSVAARPAQRSGPAVLWCHVVCTERSANVDSLGGQGHGGYHALADTGAMLAFARICSTPST